MPSFPFSAEEWMETWSAGNAVLQGMGLEITRDFLFFDLLVVLFEEKVHLLFLDLDPGFYKSTITKNKENVLVFISTPSRHRLLGIL